MENQEKDKELEQDKNQEQKPNQDNATDKTSVEQMLKSFEEKTQKMQDDFQKKLAEKDDIIKQLIMQKVNGDEKLSDDEQSIKNITQRINERR